MIKLNNLIKKFFITVSIFLILSFIYFLYFREIYLATTPLNNYHYFEIWLNIKNISVVFFLLSNIILSYNFSSFLFRNSPKLEKIVPQNVENEDSLLSLTIGTDLNDNPIIVPEKGLYQNFLITGSIGSGKTSSAMYPYTKQLIKYCHDNNNNKIGMLILDVKGNYYSKVLEFAKEFNRLDDIIVIQIGGNYLYNPLNKPNLKPSILANQLKTILLLFSPNNTESYWLDKVESALCEAIKLCRLYNNNYVTFSEIHNLITDSNYYINKINILRNLFISGKLSKQSSYDLLSALNFFEKEFFSLDDRTLNILKSEITRITNVFVSDYEVTNTFCPSRDKLNFFGFFDVIQSGKIVVLNMNISKYKNLSKIISAYLKIDFQTEVLNRLSSNIYSDRPVAFISDEYSEYVTATDSNFFSQSREAKCINIVSTQSYTSILNTLNNKYSTEVITQNLINKIWFRSDDLYTIESAQKQFGKKNKEIQSHTLSENAKQTNYNFITNTFNSRDSNISESINTSVQFDYIYDSNFFTQSLQTFSSLCFLSNGNNIFYTGKINMNPSFK